MKRVFLIVMDSVGIGAAADAAAFGDAGSDTWGSCYKSGKLFTPNMEKLGINNIEGTSFYKPIENVGFSAGTVSSVENVGKAGNTVCCFGRMAEKSAGKDTTVGHWEMAGLISESPLPTYPDGFPPEIIEALKESWGRGILCNKPSSGTKVIMDYGREAEATGSLIVYTSADSVMQIAAHEDMIPPDELYDICRKARKIMCGKHACGRIIARPYIGEYPNYTRTTNRHDFSLEPPGDTILDAMKAAGFDTIGVGKIYDIFAGRGLTETTPNEGNHVNMEKTISIAKRDDWNGLCFVNLVDFDMIHGHRRDIATYTEALNEFDVQLGELLEVLQPEDILIITADHGCDPGFTGTDHTREYVPCLALKMGSEQLGANNFADAEQTSDNAQSDSNPTDNHAINIGTRSTFADIAATIADYFDVDYKCEGTSFL